MKMTRKLFAFYAQVWWVVAFLLLHYWMHWSGYQAFTAATLNEMAMYLGYPFAYGD